MGAWIEIAALSFVPFGNLVAPLVGAWIEICFLRSFYDPYVVAPLVGAWIEILNFCACRFAYSSLPSWERGLKYLPYTVIRLHIRRSPRGSVD